MIRIVIVWLLASVALDAQQPAARGGERGHIGTTLRDPYIDYRMMAATYGMAGEGPISDPLKLGPALKRGIASVKRGQPYMIDVITQPR